MKIEDIIKNCKIMEFPNSMKNAPIITYRSKDINTVELPVKGDMLYSNKNRHHYTTEYHRQYVVPAISKLFNVNYDPNDFTIVELESGIDFQFPKVDKNFIIKCFDNGIEYHSTFSGLLKNKHTEGITWSTTYHDLFCLPHLSSIIRNESKNNGRSILILGDSQMIPSLAIIAYYYKTLTYIDNRRKINIASKLEDDYDDVLISIYGRNIDYYLDFLNPDYEDRPYPKSIADPSKVEQDPAE